MSDNDHGWTELPGVAAFGVAEGDSVQLMPVGGTISIGRPFDRRTCGCTKTCPCTRVATQEDFLCDECRAVCR